MVDEIMVEDEYRDQDGSGNLVARVMSVSGDRATLMCRGIDVSADSAFGAWFSLPVWFLRHPQCGWAKEPPSDRKARIVAERAQGASLQSIGEREGGLSRQRIKQILDSAERVSEAKG